MAKGIVKCRFCDHRFAVYYKRGFERLAEHVLYNHPEEYKKVFRHVDERTFEASRLTRESSERQPPMKDE